ncbi:MAG TPA: hypothetical protein VFL80_10325 [Thermoanaerobaculia bacterium]|nr:hypothetical protein [Thermoanaerobaculia bacterium]
MLQVVESIDRIATLVCEEHGLAPVVATTFSGSGYVSGCCEKLLDAVEAAAES